MQNTVREALLTVMTVCGVGGVLLVLCPEGKDSGMKKQVSLLLSLLLCLGLLLPLRDADLSDIREALAFPGQTETGDGDPREKALRLTEENLEKQLCAVLTEKYGIRNPVLMIRFDTEETPVRVVSAVLRGEGDLTEGSAYLEEFLACPVSTEEP